MNTRDHFSLGTSLERRMEVLGLSDLQITTILSGWTIEQIESLLRVDEATLAMVPTFDDIKDGILEKGFSLD